MSRRTITIEEMQEMAARSGGHCLSDTYAGVRRPLRWRCAHGHEWEARPEKIAGGSWCPQCGHESKHIGKMRGLAAGYGGRCISENYVSVFAPLLWRCAHGHVWQAAPRQIRLGYWCRQCKAAPQRAQQLVAMQDLARSRNGQCLSTAYGGHRTKLKWQCEAGHVWETTPATVLRGSWCPHCSARLMSTLTSRRLAEARKEPAPQPAGGEQDGIANPDFDRQLLSADRAVSAVGEVDPLQHLPAELHEVELGFLEWLGAIDDSEPECCPCCGGLKRLLRAARGPRLARNLYGCLDCGRGYNTLTGTPFARMQHSHLWRAFMSLRLAGWSLKPIREQLAISLKAATGWNRQFLIAMQMRTPHLHRWWQLHQERQDLSMPAALEDQARQFVEWVSAMSKQPGRLEGTPFHRMDFRQHWMQWAQLLLQGLGFRDIEQELGISRRCASAWHGRFEQALAERYPDLLAWIRWQRSRRYGEISRRGRQRPARTLGALGSDEPVFHDESPFPVGGKSRAASLGGPSPVSQVSEELEFANGGGSDLIRIP
jgi:transposase-like protein